MVMVVLVASTSCFLFYDISDVMRSKEKAVGSTYYHNRPAFSLQVLFIPVAVSGPVHLPSDRGVEFLHTNHDDIMRDN